MSAADSKKALRQSFRAARNALSKEVQHEAATCLLNQVIAFDVLDNAQHVALYLSQDGELSCGPLIDWCWQQQKKVYLPVIKPDNSGTLIFCEYRWDSPMGNNQFGIPEPNVNDANCLPIAKIDVIFMPLVAFDHKGNRLGMGGGYYDRTFAQLQPTHSQANLKQLRPSLFGVAHDCQQSQQLVTENWDIPVDKVITPTQIITAPDI